MAELFDDLDTVDLTPTRRAGLQRLEGFAPAMGRRYASERNHDFGPRERRNVSMLSPWIRTRQILEEEAARKALERFALSTAEKFVQEVCWRTYFKGWLEHRPAVWTVYRQELDRQHDRLAGNAGLRTAFEEATEGRTGIDCFDAWARELVDTGYLHNHARMWFASIWIFTLKLPWELGADFFVRHLMDGDAASNTLSWRWVGGLHTPGKTYLARRANIRKYTDARFDPEGLAPEAPAIDGFANPPKSDLRHGDRLPEGEIAMLLTEEDMNVETLRPPGARVAALGGVVFPDARSPEGAGVRARDFVGHAMSDALERGEALLGVVGERLDGDADLAAQLRELAGAAGTNTILTGFPPVGWVRPKLDAAREALADEGIHLLYRQRDWDAAFWPHATAGFFKLKKQIPATLAELGLPV
ncbi:MAG: DNA photolyase [Alphaproteobacteria bacterium]|jgi:deoxyribodipyrimidine photo-lyase|nr:DNA photolyase [Alphaproteobacteria bacterium]